MTPSVWRCPERIRLTPCRSLTLYFPRVPETGRFSRFEELQARVTSTTKHKPEKRFRAAIEAFGRHDLKEIDRLNDSCSVKTVRMQCPAYFGQLRGFHELATMHCISARCDGRHLGLSDQNSAGRGRSHRVPASGVAER